MCGYVGFIDHDQIRDPLFAVRNMSQAKKALWMIHNILCSEIDRPKHRMVK